MKNGKEDIKREIQRTLNESDYRKITSKAFKAAFFLHNDTSDLDFTHGILADACGVSRSQIPKALWKLLMGYTDLKRNSPYFLAPRHEEWLADRVHEAKMMKSPKTREEIIQMVCNQTHLVGICTQGRTCRTFSSQDAGILSKVRNRKSRTTG